MPTKLRWQPARWSLGTDSLRFRSRYSLLEGKSQEIQGEGDSMLDLDHDSGGLQERPVLYHTIGGVGHGSHQHEAPQ